MKIVSISCVVEQFFCYLHIFDLLFASKGVSIVHSLFSNWKLLACVSNNEFFIILLLRFLLHCIITFFTA